MTLRELREAVAEKLGLNKNGLDDRAGLVQELTQEIVDGKNPPEFKDGARVVHDPPANGDFTFEKALKATAGFILRKTAKPRLIPHTHTHNRRVLLQD